MCVVVNSHCFISYFFFFNDTATTQIYTLSLHDALPISLGWTWQRRRAERALEVTVAERTAELVSARSEEHTSELQSRQYLVCRLLLEKKKTKKDNLSDKERSLEVTAKINVHRQDIVRAQ